MNVDEIEWPPAPITEGHVSVRPSHERDRPMMIGLFSSDAVGRFVGGAQSREALERTMPARPGARPGFFVIEVEGHPCGIVTIDVCDHARHVTGEGGSVDVPNCTANFGYMVLPQWWGQGLATAACALVLAWWDGAGGGELSATAQVANAASIRVAQKLGFSEVDRYEEYGALQWRGVRQRMMP